MISLRKFNIKKALKHDYALVGSLIFVVVLIAISVYSIIKGDIITIIVFSSLAIIFIALGIWRLFVLKSYFKNSISIEGVIVKIWFTKDRGRVTFAYDIEGKTYINGSAIMKTKMTEVFEKGLKVNLLVKSDKHNKSIIEELYS